MNEIEKFVKYSKGLFTKKKFLKEEEEKSKDPCQEKYDKNIKSGMPEELAKQHFYKCTGQIKSSTDELEYRTILNKYKHDKAYKQISKDLEQFDREEQEYVQRGGRISNPVEEFEKYLSKKGGKESSYNIATINEIAKYVIPIGNKIVSGSEDDFLAILGPRYDFNFKLYYDSRTEAVLTKSLKSIFSDKLSLAPIIKSTTQFGSYKDLLSLIGRDLVALYSAHRDGNLFVFLNLYAMNEDSYERFKKEHFELGMDTTGHKKKHKREPKKTLQEDPDSKRLYKPKENLNVMTRYKNLQFSDQLIRVLYIYKNFVAIPLSEIEEYTKSLVGDLTDKDNRKELLPGLKVLEQGPALIPKTGENTLEKALLYTPLAKALGKEDSKNPNVGVSKAKSISLKYPYNMSKEKIFKSLAMLETLVSLDKVEFSVQAGFKGAQEDDEAPKKSRKLGLGQAKNRVLNNIEAYFERYPPRYSYKIDFTLFEHKKSKNIRESINRTVPPRLMIEGWDEVANLLSNRQLTNLTTIGKKLTIQDPEETFRKLDKEIRNLEKEVRALAKKHEIKSRLVPPADKTDQVLKDKQSASYVEFRWYYRNMKFSDPSIEDRERWASDYKLMLEKEKQEIIKRATSREEKKAQRKAKLNQMGLTGKETLKDLPKLLKKEGIPKSEYFLKTGGLNAKFTALDWLRMIKQMSPYAKAVINKIEEEISQDNLVFVYVNDSGLTGRSKAWNWRSVTQMYPRVAFQNRSAEKSIKWYMNGELRDMKGSAFDRIMMPYDDVLGFEKLVEPWEYAHDREEIMKKYKYQVIEILPDDFKVLQENRKRRTRRRTIKLRIKNAR